MLCKNKIKCDNLMKVIYSLFEPQMLEFLWYCKSSSIDFLKKKQTRVTFKKLVELDLVVLFFIQNYDLLKCFSINLKTLIKNFSGSNRQKIRTFSSDSASAKKSDVLI